MSDTQVAVGAGGNVADPEQLAQTVTWLEGQRLQDKEQILRHSQELERIIVQLRELAAQIRTLDEGLRSEQTRSVRLSSFDSAVRQLKEELTILKQQVEATGQAREQAVLALQAEATRAQAALTDLGHALRDLEQRAENVTDRVAFLTHELKSDRVAGADVARRVDGFDGRLEGLAGRLQLLEEQGRRNASQITSLERELAAIRAGQEEEAQWKKAVDMRAARQASEWQARAEVWQRAADEQTRLIHQFSRQLQQGLADLQSMHQRFSETFEKSQACERDIQRLEATWQAGCQEMNRLKQLVERVQESLDEQAKRVRQVEEGVRPILEKVANLGALLDQQRERTESLMASLKQADQRQRNEATDLVQAQLKAKAQYDELREQLGELRRAMDAQLASTNSAMDRIRQWEEQHRVRQIAELQRQLQELQETEHKA